MKINAQVLYNQLLTLTQEEDSPFYVVEHEGNDNCLYHVFSYRLGSYTDFLKPGALECRGTMFKIGSGGSTELVSLPFHKFFNINENPFTMELNISNETVDYITVKEDGSLITSYIDDNEKLKLKSKTALNSSMAQESEILIKKINKSYAQFDLKTFVEFLEKDGYTVIMEYVSPKNRIVLPYDKSNLVILGVRNRETFEYMSYKEMIDYGLGPYLVENVTESAGDCKEFIDQVPKMKGIEGFVVRLNDGTMFKVKTDEYVSLHHAKDSINAPRRLFETVIHEASDDLRSLFTDDEQALKEITNMEEFATHKYNHIVNSIEKFYKENKNLDRKSYAIKGQQELEKICFGPAMSLYTGKPVDYKNIVIKNSKDLLSDYKTTLIATTCNE